MAQAYIFDSIQDIKKYVGGGVNVSMSLSALKSTILITYRKYLQEWLDDAQWEDLVASADAPSEDQEKLMEYVGLPLALLSMYEYQRIGAVEMGEGGLHRLETEERKTAYKYQENNYRDYMREHGFDAIEMMLDFLEVNEAQYPLWVAGSGYAKNKALFINTARTFRTAYAYYINRDVFESLRALMQDVEHFAILPLIGQAQFDDLKGGIYQKALTAAELELIRRIQGAIAHYTVRYAVVQKWVQISGTTIKQTERLEPQSSEKQGIPSGQAISAFIRQENQLANHHISFIEQYLEAHLDSFPLYQAYQEEQATADDTTSTTEVELYTSIRDYGGHPISTYRPAKKKRPGIKSL